LGACSFSRSLREGNKDKEKYVFTTLLKKHPSIFQKRASSKSLKQFQIIHLFSLLKKYCFPYFKNLETKALPC
jgi:hypothetical protein